MTSCNGDRIEKLLRNELALNDQRDLEAHLEHCDSCRNSMDDYAAEASWWEDASEFLSDDENDLEQISSSIHATEHPEAERTKEETQAAVRQFLRLLDASDDPHMLGRFGGYEIAGVIGAGGMSFVLKGFDAALNRFVAIKVLSPHLATSTAARQRFAREAQAAAAVVHDNVIAIHSVNDSGDLPFLVMPYERGLSLQRRLDEQGALELKEILRIGLQSAFGLAAAHAQGLVHRDIKPGNILLAENVERVKLTDFGLARAVDDASLTRTGMIAGTPQYMSPEQARGDAIDQRSDLFSLGCVLYTMCTGRPPFKADSSYAVLLQITGAQPTPIRELNPSIPEWLCKLIDRLLAKSPDDRYQTAAIVATDLQQCLLHAQQSQTAEALADDPRTAQGYVPWGQIICALLLSALIWSMWPKSVHSVSGPADQKAPNSLSNGSSVDLEMLEIITHDADEPFSDSPAQVNDDDHAGDAMATKEDDIEVELYDIELELMELEQQLLKDEYEHHSETRK